jgi:hypothetical protein
LQKKKIKHLTRLCAASVLTLMLALAAFAGEIDTMRVPPSPLQVMSTGQIEIGEAGEIQTTVTGTTMEIALSLLQGVLSLI